MIKIVFGMFECLVNSIFYKKIIKSYRIFKFLTQSSQIEGNKCIEGLKLKFKIEIEGVISMLRQCRTYVYSRFSGYLVEILAAS